MRREIRDRNILFLCDDNARLSQIAEAAAKHLAPPKVRIFSAGVKPSTISASVIRAMQELGISMSGHRSKGLADVPVQDIDLVVSFGDAYKKCGTLPNRAKIETWRISQKSGAAESGQPEWAALREQRDEIDKRVFALFLDYWRNVA